MFSRRSMLAAGCAVILSACAREGGEAGPGESHIIRFAVERSAAPDAGESRWGPMLSDLRAASGLNATVSVLDSGAAVVADLRHRRADVILATSAPALEAVRRSDGEVFARLLTAPPGSDEAVLATGARDRLTLDRILKCDRTLTLGVAQGDRDRALLAADAYLFAAKGTGPARCFKGIRPAPPAALVADLANHKLDAAIIDADQLEPGERPGKTRPPHVLWRSPPLPSPSLVWRRDLDPAIKEKLRQFFLTYGQDPAARSRLASLGMAGFAPTDNDHLLVEREMEAAHAWLEARASGDKAREARAKTTHDSIAGQRQELEARTGTAAGAQ